MKERNIRTNVIHPTVNGDVQYSTQAPKKKRLFFLLFFPRRRAIFRARVLTYCIDL